MAIFKNDVESSPKFADKMESGIEKTKTENKTKPANALLSKIDQLQQELGSSIPSGNTHRNAVLARCRQLRKLAGMALP